MRQGFIEVLSCAALGLLLSQGYAQTPEQKPETGGSRGFFSGVNFNPFAKASEPKSVDPKKAEIDVEQEEIRAFKQQMEQNTVAREQARKDYLRRQAVLEALLKIAYDMQDEAMIRRIHELDERNGALNNRARFFAPRSGQDQSEDAGADPSNTRNSTNNP